MQPKRISIPLTINANSANNLTFDCTLTICH